MNENSRGFRDRLIANLREIGPPTLLDLADGEPQARVDGDERLLDAVLAGEQPPLIQRIWTNRLCIVATRAQARLPGFARTVTAGLPVAIRLSAGSAIIHHPGTLQVSLVEATGTPALVEGYRRLVSLLTDALEPLGIAATSDAVAGAYCDGRFNLCAAGRKIAGTAAFIRSRGGRSSILVHASITLAGDVRRDVARVAQFERTLGAPGRYSAAAHVSCAMLANAPRLTPQRSAPPFLAAPRPAR